MSAFQSILVPIDGSAPSLSALALAVALAEDSGARIAVLHVEAPETFSVGSTSPLSADARHQLEEALEAAIGKASAELRGRISRHTATGDPLHTIIETAREGGYDLVVVGTHGRIGRLHSLVGSVAEGVVRSAPCPVLTVRDDGSGDQSFAERRHGRPSLAERSPDPRR